MELNTLKSTGIFKNPGIRKGIIKSYAKPASNDKEELWIDLKNHIENLYPDETSELENEDLKKIFLEEFQLFKENIQQSAEQHLSTLPTRLSVWGNELKEKDLPKNPEDLLKKYTNEHATDDEKALLENDEYKTQVENIFKEHHASLLDKFGQ